MSAFQTRKDRVLTVREREKMRNEIRDRERSLQGQLVITHVNGAGAEGMSVRRQGRWNSFIDPAVHEDAQMLQSQIRHLSQNLEKGSPRTLNRRERASLEKQAAEDREYFKRQMVPARVYYQRSVTPTGVNPNFEKAKQAVFEREVSNREFQMRANRYKNNMRELDPENPDSSNIEKFRPKK